VKADRDDVGAVAIAQRFDDEAETDIAGGDGGVVLADIGDEVVQDRLTVAGID